ncbi:MAG TPA: transcriptional regulator NrdR [Chloroflexia bacterium]|nr:transcriptional regulator NrdR [Chloroflexia bacterium]
MRCPYCHKTESQVLDTRETPDSDGIRRRRRCSSCGQRFTTYERVQPVNLMIVKKDGSRVEYDRRKIESGVQLACTKRPVSAATIETLVNAVETELFKGGTNEVPAQRVGELVLNQLRDVDQVAYIRFASVYLNFADLAEMGREVESLLQRDAARERLIS